MLDITSIKHPEYSSEEYLWNKYRLVMEGGQRFLDTYLKQFSTRENLTDFNNRKNMTPVAAHSKSAIIDIKNAIYNRMSEILRTNGPDSYKKAVLGQSGGVDNRNSTMNSYIATKILPDLLAMRRVGVFVDKHQIGDLITMKDAKSKRPYLYTYGIEDIRSWAYDDYENLTSVLLRDNNFTYDDATGLATGIEKGYRLLQLMDDGIQVSFYNENGKSKDKTVLLHLNQIPFVIFEISQSLLIDIADYQIALTNMGSSDISYILNANFPFYTEQFDPRANLAGMVKKGEPIREQSTVVSDSGTAATSNKAGNLRINVGVMRGRAYPINTERPGFINPSSEPLKASMEKQDIMKEEIRQLLNLSLSNLAPRRASAESKDVDERGKEAGLAVIAFELEAGERKIANIWSEYEGYKGEEITVEYPQQYSLKSDSERQAEAKEKLTELSKIPSLSAQKVLAIQATRLLVGTQVSNADRLKIQREIENAQVVNIDPEVIRGDVEAGLLSNQTASKARLYPDDEAAKAKVDHADRLARIAMAQSDAASRGIKDLSVDPNASIKEKQLSQNPDLNKTGKKSVRGKVQ